MNALVYDARPVRELRGSIAVPGDKSISHRAVMFAGIAEGLSEITGFLPSADCLATMRAMRALGVDIRQDTTDHVIVQGVGLHGLRPAAQALDMGNAGTAMRLFTGLLAAQRFDSELFGDASLMKRPMERVATPLRLMGATITTTAGKPPLSIQGGASLKGIDYAMPVASAQVKSAVLIAGLFAQGQTAVREPAVSRDHSERMLIAMGARIESVAGRVSIHPVSRLVSQNIEVPGDFSSAAFFIIAGLLAAKNSIVIRNVGLNPTRTGLLDILRAMGARIDFRSQRQCSGEPVADLEVWRSELRGIAVPASAVPLAIDEFPALFVAAACARGETVVTGAEELRVKESDRLATMSNGLTVLRVPHELSADGIRIEGSEREQVFTGGVVDSHGDHRIAMSFVLASLRAAAPIRILDTANVATSFPNFLDCARTLGFQIAESPA